LYSVKVERTALYISIILFIDWVSIAKHEQI